MGGAVLTNIFYQIITEVMRGDNQAPKVGEGRDGEHREGHPGDVDNLECLQREAANITNFIQNMLTLLI